MELSDLDKRDLRTYSEEIVDIRESLYQMLYDKFEWAEEDNKRTFSMMALTNALAVLIALTTKGCEDANTTLVEKFSSDLRKGCKWRGSPTLHRGCVPLQRRL